MKKSYFYQNIRRPKAALPWDAGHAQGWEPSLGSPHPRVTGLSRVQAWVPRICFAVRCGQI